MSPAGRAGLDRRARKCLVAVAGRDFNEVMRAVYDEIADWYEREFLGTQDKRADERLGLSDDDLEVRDPAHIGRELRVSRS